MRRARDDHPTVDAATDMLWALISTDMIEGLLLRSTFATEPGAPR